MLLSHGTYVCICWQYCCTASTLLSISAKHPSTLKTNITRLLCTTTVVPAYHTTCGYSTMHPKMRPRLDAIQHRRTAKSRCLFVCVIQPFVRSLFNQHGLSLSRFKAVCSLSAGLDESRHEQQRHTHHRTCSSASSSEDPSSCVASSSWNRKARDTRSMPHTHEADGWSVGCSIAPYVRCGYPALPSNGTTEPPSIFFFFFFPPDVCFLVTRYLSGNTATPTLPVLADTESRRKILVRAFS